MQPLQHTRLDSFSINFTLKDVIESSQRDAADEFKLRSGQIAYDTDGGSFLGRGSSGDVYRGARASRLLVSCSSFLRQTRRSGQQPVQHGKVLTLIKLL